MHHLDLATGGSLRDSAGFHLRIMREVMMRPGVSPRTLSLFSGERIRTAPALRMAFHSFSSEVAKATRSFVGILLRDPTSADLPKSVIAARNPSAKFMYAVKHYDSESCSGAISSASSMGTSSSFSVSSGSGSISSGVLALGWGA